RGHRLRLRLDLPQAGDAVLGQRRPLHQRRRRAAAAGRPPVAQAVEWQLAFLKSGLMRPHDGSKSGGYKELIPEGQVVFQLAVPQRVLPVYRKQGAEFGTGFYPLGPGNTARTNVSHGVMYGFTVFKQ